MKAEIKIALEFMVSEDIDDMEIPLDSGQMLSDILIKYGQVIVDIIGRRDEYDEYLELKESINQKS
jgi:hypothetical protein